ncbi:methyltransferase [Naganishia albida]|nr:methyltransferase [Naganishia albida]
MSSSRQSLPNQPPIYEPVCEYTTRKACHEVRSECSFPHFEPIIRPWTDLSLGQCSYLNMCYGEPLFANNPSLANANQSRSAPVQRPTTGNASNHKQCRYIHYRLVPPTSVDTFLSRQEKERSLIPRLDADTKRRILDAGDGSARCGVACEAAQWLNMDARDMNAAVLGSFDLILADPPWDIHMTLPYGTLSDDDLRSLPIPSLQPTWGLLALWVTGRAMELARELFKTWGYRRIDEIVWVKVGQLGGLVRTGRTGHWLNHTCEHLLIALKLPPENEFPDRSAPIPWDTDPRLGYLKRGVDGDVVVAEGRETSRKPDEFYGILERMVPNGRKLEIFGRKHNVKEGWLTIGNQLGDSNVVDPILKQRLDCQNAPPLNAI